VHGIALQRVLQRLAGAQRRSGCRSETFINISGRSVEQCTLNGKELLATEHEFDGTLPWLHGLRAGTNCVSVTAQCEYQHTGVGLHRFGDPIDGEVYLYTQLQPSDAHKMLACFDQPTSKVVSR
jgi:aminopeptidase N